MLVFLASVGFGGVRVGVCVVLGVRTCVCVSVSVCM